MTVTKLTDVSLVVTPNAERPAIMTQHVGEITLPSGEVKAAKKPKVTA